MSKTVGATVRPVANDVPGHTDVDEPGALVPTSAVEAGRPLQLVLPPGLDGGLPTMAGRLVAGDRCRHLHRPRASGPAFRRGRRQTKDQQSDR